MPLLLVPHVLRLATYEIKNFYTIKSPPEYNSRYRKIVSYLNPPSKIATVWSVEDIVGELSWNLRYQNNEEKITTILARDKEGKQNLFHLLFCGKLFNCPESVLNLPFVDHKDIPIYPQDIENKFPISDEFNGYLQKIPSMLSAKAHQAKQKENLSLILAELLKPFDLKDVDDAEKERRNENFYNAIMEMDGFGSTALGYVINNSPGENKNLLRAILNRIGFLDEERKERLIRGSVDKYDEKFFHKLASGFILEQINLSDDIIFKGVSETVNRDGNSPIHLASAYRCNILGKFAEIMKAKGAQRLFIQIVINTNRLGENALHMAFTDTGGVNSITNSVNIICDNLEAFPIEHKIGVLKVPRRKDGATPLHLACASGDHLIVHRLFQKIPPEKARELAAMLDGRNRTSLHITCEKGDVSMLREIVAKLGQEMTYRIAKIDSRKMLSDPSKNNTLLDLLKYNPNISQADFQNIINQMTCLQDAYHYFLSSQNSEELEDFINCLFAKKDLNILPSYPYPKITSYQSIRGYFQNMTSEQVKEFIDFLQNQKDCPVAKTILIQYGEKGVDESRYAGLRDSALMRGYRCLVGEVTRGKRSDPTYLAHLKIFIDAIKEVFETAPSKFEAISQMKAKFFVNPFYEATREFFKVTKSEVELFRNFLEKVEASSSVAQDILKQLKEWEKTKKSSPTSFPSDYSRASSFAPDFLDDNPDYNEHLPQCSITLTPLNKIEHVVKVSYPNNPSKFFYFEREELQKSFAFKGQHINPVNNELLKPNEPIDVSETERQEILTLYRKPLVQMEMSERPAASSASPAPSAPPLPLWSQDEDPFWTSSASLLARNPYSLWSDSKEAGTQTEAPKASADREIGKQAERSDEAKRHLRRNSL